MRSPSRFHDAPFETTQVGFNMAGKMSIEASYATLGCSIVALLALSRLFLFFHPSSLRVWLHQHLFHPILFANVTRSQALLLLAYVAVNILVLVFPRESQEEVGRKAALISALNIIPLSLGGRTNYFADALGIPLGTYRFWHFWMGRVALMQALLHAGIMLARQPIELDSSVVAGWIVSGVSGASARADFVSQDLGYLPVASGLIRPGGQELVVRALCQDTRRTRNQLAGRLDLARSLARAV